ncbi:hypothetical protein BGZ63DRAFT_428287 [Mariannaea sp. PMI_226]|nr:hypothetical protein BGZ63DRAFT_428287 [Mariannaea sp. PMI_226]
MFKHEELSEVTDKAGTPHWRAVLVRNMFIASFSSAKATCEYQAVFWENYRRLCDANGNILILALGISGLAIDILQRWTHRYESISLLSVWSRIGSAIVAIVAIIYSTPSLVPPSYLDQKYKAALLK